jgi:dienelactone hydrolase
LHIEHLSWALSYGPETQAYFLKPAGAKGRLPGVLCLHDHGGNKYFGKSKITRVSDNTYPALRNHQHIYYGGAALTNEIAKQGYSVLVHDVFPPSESDAVAFRAGGCERTTSPVSTIGYTARKPLDS